ncbi:DUF2304 domain-containing protein [Paenibacillus turpanensis]|uniref:DUF2304 domain-containing protein n=1 Tax=Paenibacillus turpanensis TaxID=2689078 RepID=UPI00140C26CF|nr:DUF2304 domain-containing protein [Paenibacillus turpanensis]
MIPLRLQLILFCLALIGLIYIINMIRKYKLELKYSLLWLFLGMILLGISLFPEILTIMSSVMNIEQPSNALFLFGILSLLSICLNLTMSLSKNSQKIKELIQEVGILKDKIEKMDR